MFIILNLIVNVFVWWWIGTVWFHQVSFLWAVIAVIIINALALLLPELTTISAWIIMLITLLYQIHQWIT